MEFVLGSGSNFEEHSTTFQDDNNNNSNNEIEKLGATGIGPEPIVTSCAGRLHLVVVDSQV